eukprot:4469957-Prymnesium_polylepis.2
MTCASPRTHDDYNCRITMRTYRVGLVAQRPNTCARRARPQLISALSQGVVHEPGDAVRHQ